MEYKEISYPADSKFIDLLAEKALKRDFITIKGINEKGQKFEVKARIFVDKHIETREPLPIVSENSVALDFKHEGDFCVGKYKFGYSNFDSLSILEILDNVGNTIYQCPKMEEVKTLAYDVAEKSMQEIAEDKDSWYMNLNENDKANIKIFEDNIGKPLSITRNGEETKAIAISTKGKIVSLSKGPLSGGGDYITDAKIKPLYEEVKQQTQQSYTSQTK